MTPGDVTSIRPNDVTPPPDACIAVTALARDDVTGSAADDVTSAPAWAGQTVNLADLPEFCRRYGVTVCGVDVPRGVMTLRQAQGRPLAPVTSSAGMPLPPDDPGPWAAIVVEESAAMAFAEAITV